MFTLSLLGDTDVNWQSFDGKTALLTATEEGHIECMTLLLDHKANPNIPDAMDQYPILQGNNKMNTLN